MSLERYWGMTYVVMRVGAELGHEMDVSNFVAPPMVNPFSFPSPSLVWVEELTGKLVLTKLAADGEHLPQGYVDVASRGLGGCSR